MSQQIDEYIERMQMNTTSEELDEMRKSKED